MRKKSHISLARYIVANTKDEELKKHKLSFYIGSILPDCKPSFVYKRHEISGTFPLVKKHIEYLVEGKKNHTGYHLLARKALRGASGSSCQGSWRLRNFIKSSCYDNGPGG